jgi:hypothetical protein
MSFDGMAMFHNVCAAYGELFLDDISNLLGIFSNDDSGDKWGALFGVKVFNPLPFLPLSLLKAEVAQLEPWVYTTSARPDLKSFNYPVHFGQPLGNRLGPHSRALTLDLKCHFTKRTEGELAVRKFWKGRGPGSAVFEHNTYVLDTIDGVETLRQMYLNKDYRFEDFDRNRVVLSAAGSISITDWLRARIGIDVARESVPETMNLYRVSMDMEANY